MRMASMVLVLSVASSVAPAADPSPTYTREISRILFANCVNCHRPGEVGPFSLLTYQDAFKKSDMIVRMVSRHRMPPWKAEPQEHKFMDERRLSDAEIQTIRRWVDAGAPQGNPKDMPPYPRFSSDWQLGRPDMVVKMPEPYTVPAEGRDVYRCFVIPSKLLEGKTVSAVEFKPGNRAVVHHALFFLDTSGKARELDAKDPEPGYKTFGGPGFLPSGALGGWAPGATYHFLPEGVGRAMPKGSDIVFQMHYHPSGKPEVDQSTLAIYFTRKPAENLLIGLPLGTRTIDIPAGESNHHISTEFTLPVGLTAYGITPHMHLIGRAMTAVAHLPNGKSIQLIKITDWDFNWQDQYLYAKPLNLPRGTRIAIDAWYDNSDANPRNPKNPPERVKHGEQTFNEMCYCFLNVVPDSKLGYLALLQSIDQHFKLEKARRAKQVSRIP